MSVTFRHFPHAEVFDIMVSPENPDALGVIWVKWHWWGMFFAKRLKVSLRVRDHNH